MVATLFLWGCVLATGQTTERAQWLLGPRLSRGQEIVYSGSFSEESNNKGVRFSSAYRLENRLLILESGPRGADVAVQTVVRLRALPGGKTGVAAAGTGAESSSARLETVKVDPQGRLTALPGVTLAIPLDGPPSLECGAFVEVPRQRLGLNQSWEIGEDNRPVATWTLTGNELVGNVRCLKLAGVQQTDDWDEPRGDHAAWRRRDTVWVDPALGIAFRVERTIEWRDAAHREPTRKAVLRYDRETVLQYPRQLFEDRRSEVLQARSFKDTLTPLASDPLKHTTQLDTLLSKIAYHLERQPPTPYREAILQIKRQAEAARRGETPPAPPSEPATAITVATVGQTAPDFAAPNLLTKESARLRRWQGQPVLLVFYNATSVVAADVLRFAQGVSDSYGQRAKVVGLAMSSDAEQARKQCEQLKLTFPILDGSGLRQTYDVEATPKLMVVDGTGVLRGAYTGWGDETADDAVQELKRWLPRATLPATAPQKSQ
jgi:peroxiredoxin